MLLALIWQFDFPPFMVLIIAILNDGLSSFFFYADHLLSLSTNNATKDYVDDMFNFTCQELL